MSNYIFSPPTQYNTLYMNSCVEKCIQFLKEDIMNSMENLNQESVKSAEDLLHDLKEYSIYVLARMAHLQDAACVSYADSDVLGKLIKKARKILKNNPDELDGKIRGICFALIGIAGQGMRYYCCGSNLIETVTAEVRNLLAKEFVEGLRSVIDELNT